MNMHKDACCNHEGLRRIYPQTPPYLVPLNHLDPCIHKSPRRVGRWCAPPNERQSAVNENFWILLQPLKDWPRVHVVLHLNQGVEVIASQLCVNGKGGI